jgi:hypothetical protein
VVFPIPFLKRQSIVSAVVALSAACMLLAGCSSDAPTDHTADPNLNTAITKMTSIGGPQGWMPRKQSLSLVDPSLPGEPFVISRGGMTFQFKLDTSTFATVTGWDSGDVDRTNKLQANTVCQMFTGWLVTTAQTINSPAAGMKEYWVDECSQILTDPKAEDGESVWFIEPSKNQAREVWFVGALIKVSGNVGQITALLGANKYPYSTGDVGIGGGGTLPTFKPSVKPSPKLG